jgi:hypothetical protein
MAWPLTPLTTYLAGSLPAIKAFDLNQIQQAINSAFGALWSFKGLAVDGVGGQAVNPAAGLLINNGGPIEGDGANGDGNPGFQTLAVGQTADPNTGLKRKLVWLAQCDTSVAPVFVRIYTVNDTGGPSSGIEITVNCSWDVANTRWNQDSSSPWPVKLSLASLANNNLQLKWFNNGVASFWLDTAWTNTFQLDPTTVTSLDAEGVSGTGQTTFVAIGGQANITTGQPIYGTGHFRKAFPSAPSNLTYVGAIDHVNIGNPATIFFRPPSRWGVQVIEFSAGAGAAFNVFYTIQCTAS